MDMDMKMAVWWSFDQSRPFFSLTNVTIPAVLTIVLVILGGLAYILQVMYDSHIWRQNWVQEQDDVIAIIAMIHIGMGGTNANQRLKKIEENLF